MEKGAEFRGIIFGFMDCFHKESGGASVRDKRERWGEEFETKHLTNAAKNPTMALISQKDCEGEKARRDPPKESRRPV